MGILIDLILVAIVALYIFLSAKKGFVAVFVEIIGFVLVFALALAVSRPIADVIYDKMIEPSVVKSVNADIDNAGDKAVSALPKIFSAGVIRFGDTQNEFDETMLENIEKGKNEAIITASQEILKPKVTKSIALIIFLPLNLIFMFIIRIVARILNKLFSFSIIGKLNRLLGAAIGLPKGIIMAAIFCLIINFVLLFTSDGFLIFTPENIKASVLFEAISNIF